MQSSYRISVNIKSLLNKQAMSSLKIFNDYFSKVLSLYLVPDTNLVSDEFTEIMSNEEDKRKYFSAVENARNNKKEETVQLSSGETLVVSA